MAKRTRRRGKVPQKPPSKERKNEIIKVYASLVKKLKNHPTEAQLQESGISRHAVRWNFGSPADLKVLMREKYPELFQHIIDETVFTRKNFEKLQAAKKQYKRVVVTCAVAGAPTHIKFYKALRNYCKLNAAMLLVIPVKAPASNLPGNRGNNVSWQLDEFLGKEWNSKNIEVCIGDLELNSNIYVSGISLSAKQIDPTTGMARLAHKSSFIFGSPKQRLNVVPNSKHKLPHVAMGTGSISLPSYSTDAYMSKRTGYLAEEDHKIGAIVVELEPGDKYYYFRQLIAEPNSGNFVDLGKYYRPTGSVGKIKTSAFVLGDWHAGETDPMARKVWAQVAKDLQPDYIVCHDLFNGKSVNPHEQKKALKRAMLAEKNLLSIKDELKITAEDLENELIPWAKKKCIVVDSNHDDFLDRYLDEERYSREPWNKKIAIKLADAFMDGHNPVQVGVEMFLPKTLHSKVRWLKPDEPFILCGVELGQHGHRGPNGARGSLRNMEEAHNRCMIGHSHTPGIIREAWQVGTSSLLDQGFNEGASSWMLCSGTVYENSSRQLIFAINGKYCLE